MEIICVWKAPDELNCIACVVFPFVGSDILFCFIAFFSQLSLFQETGQGVTAQSLHLAVLPVVGMCHFSQQK